ncbi:MAG: winged helix-turn-helix transcriptional regulator, partial [Actinobacteria bacterium]|nr:winged helix-turn-helix transcriptional regulator [Actinomycetota bacterium]
MLRGLRKGAGAVAALEDDLRRRMYLFIRSQGRAISRDEAAEHVGISRKLAAFHLDKLVERGLLTAHYARLPGRTGPGAGRSSKLYEPSELEVNVSIPERRY